MSKKKEEEDCVYVFAYEHTQPFSAEMKEERPLAVKVKQFFFLFSLSPLVVVFHCRRRLILTLRQCSM